MSWERHNGKGEARSKKDTVRVAIREDSGHRYALRISIGRSVLADLGLSASARIDFFWGEDAQKGWVKLSHTTTGLYSLAMHRSAQGEKASLYLVVGCLPKWVSRRKIGATSAKFFVTPSKDLEIKLPEEFLVTYEKKRPDTNIGRPHADRGRHSPADSTAVVGAAAE